MSKTIPQRQCVGCREMKNKKDLIRVLKTADEDIIIDATGRKNGRGAYLCKAKECFQKAVKNNGLERSLKCRIPSEIVKALEEEMEQIEAR